ncbi:MAG: exostosin family protein [Capsulimonadaceae bacterium]|nr:exostosin family protein [Capsulimonadaceae bacterium]
MFRVWFSTTGSLKDRENPRTINELMQQFDQLSYDRYKLAPSPEAADAIIFFEPNNRQVHEYPNDLLSNELIRRYPEKCFAHDYSDLGIVFLPGAYVCTPRRDFDSNRTRAGGYYNRIEVYNSVVEQASHNYRNRDNIRYLFSFRGALSHPVRAALLKQDYSSVKASVRRIDRWFNHSDKEKSDYVQEILESKFVLAPRGIGTASIRLFEIMQFGRVPVIISDEWVPPSGPPWEEFSIRVAQSEVSDLPRIVSQREDEWKEMGDRAREAWEQYYSPNMAPFRLIEDIENLMCTRPANHDERKYQKEWLTARFLLRQHWFDRVYSKVWRKLHTA